MNIAVVVVQEFHVLGDVHNSADSVMAELVKLSQTEGCGVLDSAVDSDSDAGTVTIEVTAVGENQGEAINCAITAMRTAIHAAGDETPSWPTGAKLTELIDSVGQALSIERVETVDA